MMPRFLHIFYAFSTCILSCVFCASFFLLTFSYVEAFTISKSNSINNLGLVGYWTFDGKDMPNGVAVDKSGNGNNGNVFNAATSTFYTAGKIGQAGNFDGVNDYVQVNHLTALESGDMTLAGWFYFNKSPSTTQWLINQWNFSGPALFTNGNRVTFEVGSAFITGATPLQINRWYHIVAQNQGTTWRIYLNGQLDTSATGKTNTYNTSQVFRISEPTVRSGPTPFGGYADDVRIYNRALSASEINALYQAGNSKQNASQNNSLTSGLMGHWTFDARDISQGVIKDTSGQGNDGNALNIATSTFYTTGRLGQAGNFDGVDDNVVVPASTSIDNLSSMSLSIWAKSKDAGQANSGRFFYKAFGSNGWTFKYNSNALQFFDFFSTQSLNVQCFNPPNLHNVWNHWVLTRDGSGTAANVHIYKNGTEITCFTRTDGVGTRTSESNIKLSIGNTTTGGGTFNGILDDARIYNRVLSTAEINQLYQNGAAVYNSSNAFQANNLNSGLVGYWTFDGKDVVRGVIKDRSGNGNDGNTSNIATSSFYTTGKIGQGLNFDGVARVTIPNSSSLNPPSISIAFWYKNPQPNTVYRIIDKSTFQYMVRANSATARMELVAGGCGAIDTHNNIEKQNIWQFFVVTGDSTGCKWYVDGVLDTTGSSPFTGTGSSALLFSSTINSMMGQLDDVRIYNRALSASEVTQLYNMGK